MMYYFSILKPKTTHPTSNLSIHSIFKCGFWALLLFFSTSSIFAQPDSFTISGNCHSGSFNGTYTRSTPNVAGCPCYERSSDNSSIARIDFANSWGGSSNPCGSFVASNSLYTLGADPCDISTVVTGECDPATLSFGGVADVPTLSEWGLIVLALLFMTLGTLYLLQPQFNQKLKKEKV